MGNPLLAMRDRLFPHRCRYEWESVTAESVISGYPVVVQKIGTCGCGAETNVITEAGYQQLATRTLIAQYGKITEFQPDWMSAADALGMPNTGYVPRVITADDVARIDASSGVDWPPDGVRVSVAMLKAVEG